MESLQNKNFMQKSRIDELILSAEKFIENNDFENAVKTLELILSSDNRNLDALNDLVVVQILKEDYVKALSTLTKIIEIDPSNEIAKENLNTLNSLKGNPISPEAMNDHCNLMMKISLNGTEGIKEKNFKENKYTPADTKVKEDKKPKKNIKQVITLDPNWSYETFQSFYMDRANYRIKPNVVIVRPPDMNILFEINSHGFKGKEIDFKNKLVAVWGDSCVWSFRQGWVEGLDDYFNGYQFLNGGVEGDALPNIIKRACEKNLEMNISYNIIYPGWHSRKQPDLVYELLTKAIKTLPKVILCTVPISIGEKLAATDLTPYFIKAQDVVDLEEAYLFAGNIPYSIKTAQQLIAEFKGQNQIIRKLAQENKVPLIDLYKEFYVDDLETFREDFVDVGHPRVKSFPKWHKAFYKELKDVLV